MNHKRGFTMIELMIVVAIIGVVLAIVVPVLTKRFDSQEGLESLSDATTEQPAKPSKKPPCR